MAIGRSDLDQDGLNELADKSLPDVMAAAIAGTNQAYREDNRPTADLRVAAARRVHAGPVVSDADAGDGRRGPADWDQSVRPAGGGGV